MDKRNYRDMWVYIEINEGKIHHVGLELCSEVRKLCDQSGERLIAVVAGEVSEDELDKVRDSGVDGIIRVTGTGYERYNTEAYTNLFTELCLKYRPSAVFVGGTTNGRDFAPRFAARHQNTRLLRQTAGTLAPQLSIKEPRKIWFVYVENFVQSRIKA